MPIQTVPIVLEEAFMLSPKVKHFIFKSTTELPFNYLPGQFITIHFSMDNKTLRRSYSIANIPENNNRIEFAAGYVDKGPGTEYLFNLKSGDTVNMTGPFGRLVLKENTPKRYILVATSTGVTPYRAMLAELKKRLQHNPELQVVLLQGVQKREDILYGDEFTELAAYSDRVTFQAHLSREEHVNAGQHESAGYVQSAFTQLQLNPEQDMVYLCGNPGMIDESFSLLKDQGFTMQQIIREKYISGK